MLSAVCQRPRLRCVALWDGQELRWWDAKANWERFQMENHPKLQSNKQMVTRFNAITPELDRTFFPKHLELHRQLRFSKYDWWKFLFGKPYDQWPPFVFFRKKKGLALPCQWPVPDQVPHLKATVVRSASCHPELFYFFRSEKTWHWRVFSGDKKNLVIKIGWLELLLLFCW